MKSSRELHDCHPDLQRVLSDIMQDAHRELPVGEVVIVAQTWRNNMDQLAAWQCGRDADGKIIDRKAVKTYCKPGSSKHNCVDVMGRPCSRAVDLLILRYGRIVSDGKDPSYAILGAIGKRHGLAWSGDWKKSFEAAHFELPEVA